MLPPAVGEGDCAGGLGLQTPAKATGSGRRASSARCVRGTGQTAHTKEADAESCRKSLQISWEKRKDRENKITPRDFFMTIPRVN